MKIATAAYPLDEFDSWSAYEDKIARWVQEAATAGAELLLFPEYGAMELATLDAKEVTSDLEASVHAVSDRIEEVDALHMRLAKAHSVHIMAASAPVFDVQDRPVNRARLFSPDGQTGYQDKQIMTRFEREVWDVVPGDPLMLFDTAIGKIGCLICYDAEFPLLGRALVDAGAEIILVPSCTEELSGYWRVRIGAMARALEGQCVCVMSSTVGAANWSPAVDMNTGMGGVFGPPDIGFPATGVIAEGELNKPGWTFADIDLTAVSNVRADGRVLNNRHWAEQHPRVDKVTYQRMR